MDICSHRSYWIGLIERAWKRRSVVWLSGLRRVGKSTICRSLKGAEYYDCELPSVRRQLADPETFLRDVGSKKIVLDEIHRLGNPSEILKIAADHFPNVRIIATGSSTLGASRKFKDTLTGRKFDLWLTPMNTDDLIDFGNTDLKHRLLRGGLPPFFLEKHPPEKEFLEWLDSYWAKDIQELFRLEKKTSFQKFFELLFQQSGGIFEAQSFAAACEASRQTIQNYLRVLELTYVAHVLKPFHSRKTNEIIAAPKVYMFDTGFLCFNRGWNTLRNDDLGVLWEHFVLNEIHSKLQTTNVNYWRDKQGHEIDFILRTRHAGQPTAIECKWDIDEFDSSNLEIFRAKYPHGENFTVAQNVRKPYTISIGGNLKVKAIPITGVRDI